MEMQEAFEALSDPQTKSMIDDVVRIRITPTFRHVVSAFSQCTFSMISTMFCTLFRHLLFYFT
jgi:hypothetical protein